ncbi:hypothetical protein OESDEN_22998 [Oesophagostomum dentatum]|uniref:Uncharacterized protein n=1 Tax=Oesophagostomum dentatum TaxID=61180 RepID=A0A0B1S1K7_OESDE|nr:hypothetical protein OESDEN_22998 [Oesophagostomum dentatum]
MVQKNGRLRDGHNFWAHIWLMEEDDVSEDDVLDEVKVESKHGFPMLTTKLNSGPLDDGLWDDHVEVYLYVRHNCVKNYNTTSKVYTKNLGSYRIDGWWVYKKLPVIELG